MKAIVTGASTGMGKYFALELSKRGYDLTLVARNTELLEKLKLEIESSSKSTVKIISLDLTDYERTMEIMSAEAKSNYDLLINNAGIGMSSNFIDQDLKTVITMMNINMVALTQLTHIFLNEMKKVNKGLIINNASIVAYMKLFPKFSVYTATKKFVKTFSESLNFELRKTNIQVSTLLPGFIVTDFFKRGTVNTKEKFLKKGTPADKFAKKVIKKMVDKRKKVYTSGKFSLLFRIIPKLLPKKLLARILEKYN